MVIAALMLGACAGDIATPVPVTPLASAERAHLQISDITAEAKPGVVMTSFELTRIVERVRAEIGAQFPTVLVDASTAPSGGTCKMQILFSQYDRGNSFARFMIAGAGQIHIDADVLLIDAQSGQLLAKYQVSKQFAFGGVYGASTKIEDVEEGSTRSVAEILREKKT
ncbi:MAG TPA: DUF4410 domain-containing protein [Candidatus Sulfotelmatobacter sp.]|nr:DUF4410 domain-containing protein [Candidatus Sulfotelmatobacter sp.]